MQRSLMQLLEGDERYRLVKGWLRHPLATNLLLNGADVTLFQKQLRHRDIKSTMIYLHITTEKQKDLYDRFIPGY